MAGGVLAETHANRRTDYAMISDAPADLANAPDYADVPRPDGDGLRRAGPGAADRAATRSSSSATRTRTGATSSSASDLAARADAAGLVPKGDLIWHQAGTRLRPYGYPRVFVPNIAHQHILVLRREPRTAGVRLRRRLSR